MSLRRALSLAGMAVALLTLPACQATLPALPAAVAPAVGAKILSGRAVFPGYAVAATSVEVAQGAAVTLAEEGGAVRAAGVSDARGAFTLYQSTTPFVPQEGAYYTLEAMKRIGARGQVVALRTVLHVESGSWRSITGDEIVINATTTALAELLLHDAGVQRAMLIGLVKDGTTIGALPGLPPATLAARVAEVTDHVAHDLDPVPAAGPLAFVGDYDARTMGLADLARYERITGNLTVAGVHGAIPALPQLARVDGGLLLAYCPDMHDLACLPNLRSVGSLYVSGTALTSLAGLHLTEVRGNVTVLYNHQLASLDGLDDVRRIGGLQLVDNDALADCSALAGLEAVANPDLPDAGQVVVVGNPALPALALPAVASPHLSIVVQRNAALATLALPAQAPSADIVMVQGNDALTTVRGLDHLRQVGLVVIAGNASLAAIPACPELATANSVLVGGSPALASIDGFGAFTSGVLSLVDLPGLTHLGGIGPGGPAFVFQAQGVALQDLHGLAGIHQALSIGLVGLPALTSAEGLDAQIALQGLTVALAPSLTSLDGIQALPAPAAGGPQVMVLGTAVPAQQFLNGVLATPEAFCSLVCTSWSDLPEGGPNEEALQALAFGPFVATAQAAQAVQAPMEELVTILEAGRADAEAFAAMVGP